MKNNIEMEQIVPEEPTTEEQIRMATQELERKNNDLVQQIYNKESQIHELERIIKEQEETFNRVTAKLVVTLLDR